MLFNSVEFIFLFLPVVFFLYIIFQRFSAVAAITVLCFSSLFFYAWWDVSVLPILLVSVTFNFLIGSVISTFRTRGGSGYKWLMTFGVAANLIALLYYKYFGFFALQLIPDILNIGNIEVVIPRLPIGISFFTFTQIAFLVDAAEGKCGEYSPLHYALFVSYFPHLIAGPILHHSDMMPQFKNAKRVVVFSDGVRDGLALFGVGLAKKLLIADSVGFYSDKFFGGVSSGTEFAFFEALFGSLCYTFQLYYDFSGYSDMAVGISRMFGVELPINFNSPYKSASVIEFWRRWHISLSRFLRDYLYIALGGNRKGMVRRYTNLITTMLIGGAWHGAGWTFIFWGGLHGVYLTINHCWRYFVNKFVPGLSEYKVIGCFGYVLTFIAVTLAWIPFRASTLGDALKIIHALVGGNGFVLPDQVLKIVPLLGSFVLGAGSVPLLADGTVMGFVDMAFMVFVCSLVSFAFRNSNEMTPRTRLLMASLFLPLVIQRLAFGGKAEFLYFQF